MRSDKDFWNSLGFRRLTKRVLHVFAQRAEESLETATTEQCPDPNIAHKYHPYMAVSRRKGNRSLRMNMVSRFLCRGTGYVSLKDERCLSELELVAENSNLATKTAAEFVARLLLKTESHVAAALSRQEMKCLNFCFDEATVATEKAPWEGSGET